MKAQCKQVKCHICNGEGKVTFKYNKDNPFMKLCKDSTIREGKTYTETCNKCNGDGILKEKSNTVKL